MKAFDDTTTPLRESGPQQGTSENRWLFVLLVSLIVVLGGVTVQYVTLSDIDADEVEHVHIAWGMSRGIMPYRDIHQEHTPLLWILSAPVVAQMPESTITFVLLRAGCVLVFLAIYGIGLLVLREICGRWRGVHALVLLPLMLCWMRDFEFYRFRPDPFMAFCAACAVLAAVRLRRAPLRYSFLSGMALGVAATFSLKMAPLCLLVPLLCIVESRRLKSWRPLSLVIPNGLGFLVGTLPMFCWLTFHGLLNAYLSIGSHALGLFITDASTAMENAIVLLGLAVFGGFLAIRMQLDRPQTAWPSAYGAIAAALLASLMPMIEPNRLTYNFQAFLMPAAVLGTMLVASLLELDHWPWKLRLGMVAAVFAFAAIKPVLCGIEGTTTGVTVPMADLQRLIELRTSDDATCVGFAPWHPAFCRDATDLYVGWDLWIFSVAGMPPERTQVFRKMWSEAVSRMEQNKPSFIIDRKPWTQAHNKRIISDEEYRQFEQLIRSDYQAMTVGQMLVYVRKDLVASGATNVKP